MVGLQQRYRDGLAALGVDFAQVDGKEQRARLRGRGRRVPRAALGALLRGHVRGARVRRQPGGIGWAYIGVDGDVQPRGYSDAEVSEP